MTVSSSTSKSRYTGNGVTTAFTGSFRILDETHVLVTHTSTLGVDTTKTIVTDYTVSGVGGSSFTVTHGTAPASGVIVTLSRNVPATQELDLVENDAMPADDLETAFDKATMLFQQAKEAADRSVRFPVSDSTSRTAELPSASLRAGKVLGFDADGDVTVSTEDLTDIEGAITEAAASAAAAAASASAAATAETNAETAEAAAEAAQAAAEAAAASVPSFPIDPNDTTFAATKRVLGRDTAGAGTGEEVTLSQLLDWIGSAAQGDILYRDSSSWARLAAGTSGQFLKTNGAGANPSWASGSTNRNYAQTTSRSSLSANTIPNDGTIPQITEGTEILSTTITPSSVSARIRITAVVPCYIDGVTAAAALFIAGTNDALAVDYKFVTATGSPAVAAAFVIQFEHVPGSASSQTYSVRCGPASGTLYINGNTSTQPFGAKQTASIVVEEVA